MKHAISSQVRWYFCFKKKQKQRGREESGKKEKKSICSSITSLFLLLMCVHVFLCNSRICGHVPVSLWVTLVLKAIWYLFVLFCSFVNIHFQLLACPFLMCSVRLDSCVMLHPLSVCFMSEEMVICILHVAVVLPHPFQTLWQSIVCWRVQNCFFCFLLCCSKGLCCDKSDSLIEQLSDLLDYLSVIWLVSSDL